MKCTHKGLLEKITHFQFIFSKIKILCRDQTFIVERYDQLFWIFLSFPFKTWAKYLAFWTFSMFWSKGKWWKKWTKLSIFLINYQRENEFFPNISWTKLCRFWNFFTRFLKCQRENEFFPIIFWAELLNFQNFLWSIFGNSSTQI